jgi:uncharacterized membrane protein
MSKNFFTDTEQQQIVEAIKQAELNTSGEIRVHVEPTCDEDPYQRAMKVFERLGMHATELKNGVLFYLAYQSKKFAIIGDKGIHEKVSQQFWDEEKALLEQYFKANNHADGLIKAIGDAGQKLKLHFPYSTTDLNELSNDISFGGDHE